ncbi:unnamed protein product [Heterosigma akashiwo]|mmetsp:Transcript_28067/g.48679  ORF Transcript_28067/g.48679 Transcript_28067/m.48679 type:complete len:247 (+) Transcript_28067:52-792(+)|eukprot:CAMPEP_0194560022 /NCGR_PEP_ID=MMETSP0292-20121207/1358_1 /TAXON_ID=39354 /ORGANISM="Heterosigma akashiwo, Strain CCMP2393" /LENGTH=246 /DNA_ID=CAMNT_0039408097 /DNA_START=55 /DNA_END=795 /DNA_ORIENTATION=-
MSILYEDNGITLTALPSNVLFLVLGRGQNVFNPALVSSLNASLDKVEEQEHPKALVITAEGKFYSNGLELEFLQSNSASQVGQFVESVWRLLSRILVIDCRTVAAINGHAIGAGLFLALACDYRIMCTERGILWWPELNLGIALRKGFAELTKAKVQDPRTLREGVLTGKRYSSSEALESGLIDLECPVKELLSQAEEMSEAGLPQNLGLANFSPKSFHRMKIEIYTDAFRALAYGQFDSPPQSRL